MLDLAELVTGVPRLPGPDLLLRVLRRGSRAEDGTGVALRYPTPVRGQVGLLASEAALEPELFRYVAAAMLIGVALIMLVQALNDRVTLRLSAITSRFDRGGRGGASSAPGQFGVGALLGVIWLPCVGPTLGAAIALASMGQSMSMAFVVMLAYGIGTAGVLLLAGAVSSRLLARWRPGMMSAGGLGTKVLGGTLLVLGLLVLTGMDKFLEALAVSVVPEWVFSL